MGYTVYNRSLYRNGFRPYGSTNTKTAASGMGGTPFDPEFLHGTHHQHGYPFSERGGWRLGDGAVAGAAQLVSPPWWTNFAPGIGAGVYELYQGIKLVLAPGDPTPALNVDNAVTGKLTSDQLDEIKQNAAETITQAAGGNTELAQQQIAATNAQIDANFGSGVPTWAWMAGAAVAAAILARAL